MKSWLASAAMAAVLVFGGMGVGGGLSEVRGDHGWDGTPGYFGPQCYRPPQNRHQSSYYGNPGNFGNYYGNSYNYRSARPNLPPAGFPGNHPGFVPGWQGHVPYGPAGQFGNAYPYGYGNGFVPNNPYDPGRGIGITTRNGMTFRIAF